MKNTTHPAKANNSLTLDGVTISWRDTRHMVTAEPDDFEMHGEFSVSISANGANLNAIANAYLNARVLNQVAEFGDFVCPYSDSALRPVGLDDLGDVLLQIYRGERKCSVAPAREIAHFDPGRYSKDEVAMKSITWMRDVGAAITHYRSALIASNDGKVDVFRDEIFRHDREQAEQQRRSSSSRTHQEPE